MTSIGILSPPLIDVPIVVHVRSGGRPFAAGDWVGLFMLDAAGQAASTSLAVTPPRPLLHEGRVIQDGDVPVGPATLVGLVSRDLSATAHPREGSMMVDPAAGLLATGASAPPSAALRAPASAAVVALTPAASPSASRAGSTTTSPPPPRAPAAAAVSSEGVEEEERDRSPGMANASQSEDSTSRRRHRDGSALVAAVSPPPASARGSDRHPSWAVEEATAGEERRGSGEPRVRQFSSGRPIAWQMLPTGYTAATCSFVLDPRLLDVHRDASTGAIAPVRLALRLVRQMGDAPRAPSPSATTTHGGMHDSQAVDAECTVQLVSPLHAAQVCVRPGFTLDVHFAFTRDDTVIAWHGGATPGAGTPMLHHQHDFSLVHEGSGIEVARGPVVVGCGVLHVPMPRLAGRYLVLLRDPRHQIDLLRYPVEVVTGHDFRLVLAPGAGAIQPTASPIALEIVSDPDGGRGRIHGAGVDASMPRTESSPTARAAHRARASAMNQDAAGASTAASPPPRQPRADVVDVEGGLPASGDTDSETPPEAVESSAFHIEAFTPFDVRVVASHAGAVKHGDELLILRHHGGEVWDPISAPTARFPLARQDGTWRGIILPPGRFGVALGLRHERAVLIGATHWVVVSDVPPPQPQPQPQPQQVEARQQHYGHAPQPHANGHHHPMHQHHGGGGAMHMQEHFAMAPSAAHVHNHPHPAVYLTQGANGVQWQQTPMTLGAIATHEFGYFPVPADMAFRGPHMAQPYMGGAGETRLGSGHAAGPVPAYVPTRTAGVGAAAPAAAMPSTARPWGPLPPAAAPRPAAQYPPFIAELLGTTGAGAAPATERANGAEGQAADAAHSMTALAPHHASPVPIDPSARPALRTVDSQIHADGSQTVTTTTYSSSLCMCCYERQMCVMLRPCRHVCLCEDCELQLRGTSDACPICRTTIQASERVFLP